MQATGRGSSACRKLELKTTHLKGANPHLSVTSICIEESAPSLLFVEEVLRVSQRETGLLLALTAQCHEHPVVES